MGRNGSRGREVRDMQEGGRREEIGWKAIDGVACCWRVDIMSEVTYYECI